MAEASDRTQIQISGGSYYNARTQTVHNTTVYSGDDAMVNLRGHGAPQAIHTSKQVSDQGICTTGTREKTLGHIRSFVDSSNSSPDLLWMHGPAGAGKSAIMRTTAQRLEKDGLLLASFFFFRSENERNKSTPFIPTLALQASFDIPQAEAHVAQSIRRNPTIFSQALDRQCLHLLQTPLINLLTTPNVDCGWTSTSPRVILVDGLDECMDPGGQTQIIKALARLASAIHAGTDRCIKIVVASRPELEIKTEFERLHSQDKAEVICLDSSDAELHLFYAERLEAIRAKYHLPKSWPSVEDLEWLMDKTSGQYAFADVSTRHLAGGDPVHRLQVIRQAFIDLEREQNPFESLDLLYATVFQQLPREMLQPALFVLRLRLGTEPEWGTCSHAIVEPLLQLPEGFLSRLSPHLSSLIDFDDKLRPYHASLGDFLLNPLRLARFQLHIDEPLFCKTIVRGLFAPVAASASCQEFSDVEQEAFSEMLWFVSLALTPTLRSTTDEVIALLNAVDLSRLDLWSLCYFALLCKVIRSGNLRGRNKQGPRFGSRLWYLVTLSGPRQMKTLWLDLLASYQEDCGGINIGEIVVELLGLIGDSSHGDKMFFKMLQDIARRNEEHSNFDTTHGRKLSQLRSLVESDDASHYFCRTIIGWAVFNIQGATYSSRFAQIILREDLRTGKDNKMRQIITASVDCGKGHSTKASGTNVGLGCRECSSNLVNLKRCVVNSWLGGIRSGHLFTTLASNSSMFDTMCGYIQGEEIPLKQAAEMFDKLTKYLRPRKGSLIPSFANLRRRKLVKLHQLLEGKALAFKEQERQRGAYHVPDLFESFCRSHTDL